MRLAWHQGERKYETGIDRGVLYVNGVGVPWDGLRSVDEAPDNFDPTPLFFDGEQYGSSSPKERFKATLSAFYSPELFDECDGTSTIASGVFVHQQRRKEFGLSYRTNIGESGHKIHLVYNALAAPTQRTYSTISDRAEPTPLAWSLTTRPVLIAGKRSSAHITIDTTRAQPLAVAQLEEILYGGDNTDPRLPLPAEVTAIFETYAGLVVTDNGDGTFTVTGPDDAITLLDDSFEITWPAAIITGPNTYTISSF